MLDSSLMPNYKRLPVNFVRGEGAYLWDENNIQYIDALTGIAVCGLGHAHPAITQSLREQAGLLLHTSNLYGIPIQQTLADKLTASSGMESTFFCNSGTEANEAAIKLARLYGYHQDIKQPKIIVMENSFHGRTLAALSATGNAAAQKGFAPLVEGFVRVPYDDIDSIEQLTQDSDIVAVLVEPIQGESGVKIPAADYLNQIRAICDAQNWLMMLDEVQTGIGRTGRWFAFQHNNIVPDVMCLAKGLGNGVPIGACLARGQAAELFQPGTHGSTFGGNPLVSRVALTVLETIEKDNLCQRAKDLGARFQQGFDNRLASLAGVKEIRHKGLMIGIELDKSCVELVSQALDKRLLINVAGGSIVRLLPPLILSDEQADNIIKIMCDLIEKFVK